MSENKKHEGSLSQKVKEHARKIWLITYGASCQDITYEILQQCDLKVEECYTIQWRESKYTLIHLHSKQRGSTIGKRMLKMRILFGIVKSNILGYESVTGNICRSSQTQQKLEDHPGFQKMVEILNTDVSQMRIWIHKGTPLSNAKGIFWPYIETLPSEQASKTQLKRKLEKWTPIVNEANALKTENALLRDALQQRLMVLSTRPEIDATKPPPTTRTILLHYRTDKRIRHAMRKVSAREERLNRKPSSDGSGEIYAAWNPLMPNLHKMGFTFKDATTRVRALQTAGVLEPFELIRHAKVPNARCEACTSLQITIR